MVKRATIEFLDLTKPVTEPVTKFGGQPVWSDIPQWPLSRSTGKPMRFICQIFLDPDLFGSIPGRMAYLFMTDEEEEYVDGTWEDESGENAVIVQPGESPIVETVRLNTGPTLYKMVQKPGDVRLQPESCEFAVRLRSEEDPEFVSDEERFTWSTERSSRYHEELSGNKIGGTPGFMQGDEFPDGGGWKLLLQLDSTTVPFYVNFGDAGIGYAFISEDGRRGKFLWQCA